MYLTFLRPAALLPLFVAGIPTVFSQELETIVVSAGRNPQRLDEVPVSISALSAKELGLIGAVHISEALARVPGTWISRGNGQENLTAIRSPVFTGTGSCGAFYLAEDGVPIRPSGFCNANALSEVDGEQAARIEVLRGPGTAVHGANAQHGVINVISPAAPRARTESAVSVEGGSNAYGRVLARHGAGDGDAGWLLTLNAAHDGGWKDESGYDHVKLGFRHEIDREDGRFRLQYRFVDLDQETASYVTGEGSFRRRDVKRDNPNPEAFRDNRVHRLDARWELDRGEQTTLSVTPYLRSQEMRFLQHFLLGQPLEENGADAAGLQLGWQQQLGAGLRLSSGLDAEWADGFLKETQAAPVPGISTLPAGKHYDYAVQSLMAAAFTQLEWEPAENTRLLAGLRAESQRYDYDNRMLDGATRADGSPCGPPGSPLPCRYSRPADREDSFTDWSGNLGAIQSIGEHQALVFTIARGFRPPQVAELYRLQAGQTVADIDSERVDGLELGWRGSVGALRAELTGYLMRKQEVIFQDADRRNVSGARTRHGGLEYSLSWPFAAAWRLSADGTLAVHEYDSGDRLQGLPAGVDIEGNAMDTAPRNFSSVRLAWEPDARTQLELEWLRMGRYYLEPTEQFDYPGHDLVHLRLSRQLSPAWSLGARVTNLLDEDYAERADYAFGEYRYFVGEPRGVYLELAWRRP